MRQVQQATDQLHLLQAGKIMEQMITERMTFYIESRELLSPYQSGLRKGRRTMDLKL